MYVLPTERFPKKFLNGQLRMVQTLNRVGNSRDGQKQAGTRKPNHSPATPSRKGIDRISPAKQPRDPLCPADRPVARWENDRGDLGTVADTVMAAGQSFIPEDTVNNVHGGR